MTALHASSSPSPRANQLRKAEEQRLDRVRQAKKEAKAQAEAQAEAEAQAQAKPKTAGWRFAFGRRPKAAAPVKTPPPTSRSATRSPAISKAAANSASKHKLIIYKDDGNGTMQEVFKLRKPPYLRVVDEKVVRGA